MQDLADCEVICVNDGSTDNSHSILAEYQQKYPQLIIIDRENGGLSAARNTGLKVANGEYIYFLDSDDYLYPEVLSKMFHFANQNKLEVACFNVLKDGEILYFDNFDCQEVVLSRDEFCTVFFNKYRLIFPPPVLVVLIQKSFF
jgi:glycosyltransferase involved in cell wall biosynthesis